jgi:hypothetical protein
MLEFARTQFPLTDSGPLQGYPEFGNQGNFTDTIINEWLEKHSHPPVKLLSLQGQDHLAQEHTPLHMLHKGTIKDQILGRLPQGAPLLNSTQMSAAMATPTPTPQPSFKVKLHKNGT